MTLRRYLEDDGVPVTLREQYIFARSLADVQGRIRRSVAKKLGVLDAFQPRSRRGRQCDCTRNPRWRLLMQHGWVVDDPSEGCWRIAVGDGYAPPRATPFDELDKPRQGADFNFSARVAKALADTGGYGREGQIARAADLLRALPCPAIREGRACGAGVMGYTASLST